MNAAAKTHKINKMGQGGNIRGCESIPLFHPTQKRGQNRHVNASDSFCHPYLKFLKTLMYYY